MIKVIGYVSFILIVFILATDAAVIYPLPTVLILLILGAIVYMTNERGAFNDLL